MKIIAAVLLAGLISGCSSTMKMDEPLAADTGLVFMNASCESKAVAVLALSTKTTAWFPERKIRCGKAMGMDFTGVKLFDIEAGKYFLIGQGASPKAEFAYEVEVLPGKINYLGTINAGEEIVWIKNDPYRKMVVSTSDNFNEDVAKLKEEYPEYPWNYEVVKAVPVEEYQIPK
jgi:hypothetical protein